MRDMDNRKTIIYAGKFELPDKNAEAQRVMANAKAFRALGYTVIFVGISHEEPQQKDVFQTFHQWEGFDSYTRPYPTSLISWVEHISCNRELEQIIGLHQQATVAVALYNYPALATARTLRYCKKRSIKVVADCTEWYAPYTKFTRPSPIKFLDTAWRMHRLNIKVDALIAISTYLFDYYAPKVPTFLLPPLVDLEDSKWSVERTRQDVCTIVYAGTPGKKDRIDLVISSVIESRDPLQLWIIGAQQDEFLKLYPEFIDRDISRVTFFGRLSHREVIEKIKGADYSCFFRDDTRMSNAGFPTKFVESITAGVPVITNDTSDISLYANEIGSCIVLDSLSQEAIMQAFEDASRNRGGMVKNDFFDYRAYLNSVERLVALF